MFAPEPAKSQLHAEDVTPHVTLEVLMSLDVAAQLTPHAQTLKPSRTFTPGLQVVLAIEESLSW